MTRPVLLPPIPRPSATEVQKHLALWHAGNNEKLDSALRTLFEAMPHNTDVGEVAVKLAALNGLYATNILAVVQVATHIADLGIDARLAEPAIDASLIEEIATVSIKGKVRRNYSFATKYCAFHRPDLYPIYDSVVDRVLLGQNANRATQPQTLEDDDRAGQRDFRLPGDLPQPPTPLFRARHA